MKALAPVIAGVAFAAVVLAADRPAGGEEPRVLLAGSTGTLHVRNDHSGQAVVTGTNMAPGKKVKGRVEVSVDHKAVMELEIGEVTHTPGPAGGDLVDSLKLNVRRIGRGPGGKHIYRGSVAPAEGIDLGRWRAGSSYRYRVRLQLPDAGESQNVMQGASAQFTLHWRAHEIG